MILHVAACTAREKLPERQGRTFVEGLVEVFGGKVVDGENLHVAHLVEAEAIRAKGRGAAEPLEEMPHLVGEGVGISHRLNPV